MPRQENSRIFDVGETFEHRLRQIAERRRKRKYEARDSHFDERQAENYRADDNRRQNRADNRAEKSFDGFAGTYRRGKLM